MLKYLAEMSDLQFAGASETCAGPLALRRVPLGVSSMDVASMNPYRSSAKRKAESLSSSEDDSETNDESEPETGLGRLPSHTASALAAAAVHDELDHGPKQRDSEAANALLSLYRRSSYDEPTKPPARKRFRPSASGSVELGGVEGGTAAKGDVPDRLVDACVSSSSPESTAVDEPSQAKRTPLLPKAVRVTSRAHLVLHVLYLNKRFGAEHGQGRLPFDASPLSAIRPNGSPLPSLAADLSIHRRGSAQAGRENGDVGSPVAVLPPAGLQNLPQVARPPVDNSIPFLPLPIAPLPSGSLPKFTPIRPRGS